MRFPTSNYWASSRSLTVEAAIYDDKAQDIESWDEHIEAAFDDRVHFHMPNESNGSFSPAPIG
jgi:hypothetical protein